MLKILQDVMKSFALFVAVFHVIRELVEAVETPGYGPEKRQAVLDVVTAVLDAIPGSLPYGFTREIILDFAGKVIDIWVGLYNITGRFKKSQDQAAENPMTAA